MPAERPAGVVAELRLGTDVAGLGRLYPWLEETAGALPRAMLNAMHVALEEAAVNVAMHAYPPGMAGEIVIRLEIAAGAAELVVEDRGPPFDPVAATPPARADSLDAARPGGLGLTLLRHYCRDIGYVRVDDRNRLRLRFPMQREDH